MIPAAKRVARDERIPTLPAVVGRLLAVYASEDYTLAEIVGVIERDPSITTRLMRLANSPFYGTPGEVATVGGAVMLLGGATVQGLALGASLLKPWEMSLAPKAVRDLWVHSWLCGIGCRELAALARPAGGAEGGALFVGGLLHDIGKILLLKRDPPAYAELLEVSEGDVELMDAETERFGENHRELGFDALAAWGLPPLIAGFARARVLGDLRAEHRTEAGIFIAAHELSTKGESETGELLFGGELVGRAGRIIADAIPVAESFYESIAGNRSAGQG